VCPFERIADEVLHSTVDFAPWSVGSNFVWSFVFNSLIDDVPGPNSPFVPSDRLLDVLLGKVLDLFGVSTPKEARVERVLSPEGGMTSEDNVILLSPIHNVITLSVVKVIPTLGNWLHLAVALGRQNVELLLDRGLVFLVSIVALDVPVANGSTNVHTKVLGIIFKTFSIILKIATDKVGNRHVTNCVHFVYLFSLKK